MKVQLIPVSPHTIGTESISTVNARELHRFLENKDKFATWIKDRIEQFAFVENQDYVTFSENSEKPRGGRPALGYALTLEMAKELSMVERNEKGKQARQYFIECERVAKQQTAVDPLALLNNAAAMRNILLTYTEKVIEQDKLIAVIQPKAAVADRISMSDGYITITDAAKILKVRPRWFSRYLRVERWIYQRTGYRSLIPYQDKITAGFMDLKYVLVPSAEDKDRAFPQAVFLPKGIARLASIFEQCVPGVEHA